MRRPSAIALRIVAKLSSAKTISAASFVASVPLMPIAMPTSARVRAGASLTPSPVIATTSPRDCRARTMRILCSGLVRANTSTSCTTFASSSPLIASSSAPVSTAGPSSDASTSPISRLIASAVPAWSPVIIFTRMPAVWQSAIASIASGRGGSRMPHRPRNSRSSRSPIDTVSPRVGLRAAASTRSPCALRSSIAASQNAMSRGSEPSAPRWVSERSSRRSGAPLTRIAREPSDASLSVAMNL